MVSEALQVIASKYNVKQADLSSIFNLNAGANSTQQLSINRGFVLYLLEYGGNVTTPDVNVIIKSATGEELANYTEFTDFFYMFEFLPLLNHKLKGRLDVTVTNNTLSSTTTCTLIVRGLLVQETDSDNFEADLKRYYGIDTRDA